ncbi:MAG: hypothetical protein JXM68_08050, partial [Sedimentisphaerales bacterium]|nr:hypothetical protein [Sedimentisphaerales bacterium]
SALQVRSGFQAIQIVLEEAALADADSVSTILGEADGLNAKALADLDIMDKSYLGDKAIISELKSDLANLMSVVRDVKAKSGDTEQVKTLVKVKADEIVTEVLDDIVPLIQESAKRAENFASEAARQSTSAATTVYALLSAGIVVCLVVGSVTVNSVVRPFKAMFGGLKTLSSHELNTLADKFRDIIENLNSGGGQVAQASQQLAQGATEQAAGLEETSSSLEELAAQTKQNADNAQQANQLSSETTRAALSGSDAMQRMNTAILEIQKSSEETSKIIKTIDEIAFQTNLLALNAAVEAARAGEAGKGFAVVAEEVRNLAMRSADAAKNTSVMIEESVKNSNNGVQITNEVASSLNEITASVQKVNDLVAEINSACQEQAQGIDQINISMNQMDKVTQANAANAEESASAASQVMHIVKELQDIVGTSKSASNNSGKSKAKPLSSAGKPNKSMSKSDQAFHTIAAGSHTSGQSASATNKSTREAELMIPFENDGFDEFN